MKQIIDLPTRIAEHSESQIDLIFTDNVHKIIDFGVKDFGISDHSMVYCVFKSGLMKVPPKTLEYRSFKSYNKSAFRQDLKNVPWQVALNNPEDLEGCVQTWNKLFTQVAEDHAPTKTRRVRGTPTPWMTSEIATLMRDRNYHLKKAKGNKTNFHWKQYRALRNKVQRKIKKSKSEYYCNLIKDSRNNPSDLWKSVKEAIPGSNPRKDNITSLISDGITHTNPTSMSSTFNKFFATIGVKLAEKFTMNTPTTNGVNQASSNFAFKTISCESVTKKIKELKPNKAVGLDKVSSRMLKDAADIVAPSLTSLFNISINNGCFPSTWKLAKISPLFKKGSKQDPSNYRPISVLPTISKLLEKAVHMQLYSYLRDNNLLSQKQFGFRLNSSTVTASAMFTDKTLSAMDKGQLTGAVFIDLTKAFDTVNHSILLSKLCSLGVLNDSPAYNWFESYLSNRCQVTVCNGTKSCPETVQIGVPQGSILGPLLFTLYINDLPDYLEHCDVTLYADDTVLFISDKSLHNIKSYMNSDLEKLNNWLKLNHLTLSISKSKFMIIGSSQRLNKIDSISFKVDNIDLDEVSSFKYLGIVINNRLNWQDHVDQMFSKINKKLGLLKRIRYCLPLDARLMFFNSYVLPLFDYADIVWGDRGNSTLMLQLQSLHNKAAKIILDLPIGSSASEALNKLKWKTLARRRAEHRAIFIYKCLNNLFSHRFNIEFNRDKHEYNTRCKNNIRKSASRRNWGHWTSINFASNDWNKLDLSIRQSPSLASFKRVLRNVNSFSV